MKVFEKSERKSGRKLTNLRIKINGQIQIALGSGERQSRRLREKKDSSEESRKTITPKTTKTSVVRKLGVKKSMTSKKAKTH